MPREGAEEVRVGSGFSLIKLGVTLKSLTRKSARLVLLEVSKVDTLFSISDKGQSSHEHRDKMKILTHVVSVFAKNVKNRFISEGVNITMKHLSVEKDILKVICHI